MKQFTGEWSFLGNGLRESRVWPRAWVSRNVLPINLHNPASSSVTQKTTVPTLPKLLPAALLIANEMTRNIAEAKQHFKGSILRVESFRQFCQILWGRDKCGQSMKHVYLWRRGELERQFVTIKFQCFRLCFRVNNLGFLGITRNFDKVCWECWNLEDRTSNQISPL